MPHPDAFKDLNLFLYYRPRTDVQLSVCLMIFGALVAAFNDLAFNLPGYIYLLLNDIFTAGNGVVMKKKLNAKDLGKYNRNRISLNCSFDPYVKRVSN